MNGQTILIFIAFIALMYFMMIRPQQKAAKARQELLNSVQKGSEIVTIGGLHGVIDQLDEKTFTLDADGVFLTFDRSAIRTVVTKQNVTTPAENVDAPVNDEQETSAADKDAE
ncbi:preprotein translocase subunit YajC [Weissella diestrammenae]|uniref:Preprotein translocase subunit YajC n=1 Tax=Weissella diestrammenae TaxID=1162633 RepID=A0A7G9T4Y8_9LACO|nr:preprotein translocase subunit YajC [Weissella diestrammenae]MCM0582885.1 preprotein translocase subunit YajC [Weissella diestrammenae]QNN75163.1 preprotein translocase subunit YajC [Weissella diestrammenae]